MRVIQTHRTEYKVSDFISWQRDNTLELNPNFQRRPVWKKGAKSYLIDTILRGLPVPIIFLRDLPSDLRTFKAKRDVVDGQQRIRTILSFVSPGLLTDYEPDRDDFTVSKIHNKEHAGKRFSDLASEDRQRILDYQFSVHSFSSDTDDRELLQIFARMNSTGLKLNYQELRNAEFYGEFKQVCYDLATEQLNRWRDWQIFSADQIARMAEVELTSELIILMLNGVTGKTKRQIDRYYEEYEKSFPSAGEVQIRVREMFDAIDSIFDKNELVEVFSNVTMFFGLFAVLYGLRYGLRTPSVKGFPPALERAKPTPVNREIVAHIREAGRAIREKRLDENIERALRGATTDAGSRRVLIGFLAGQGNDPCPPQN